MPSSAKNALRSLDAKKLTEDLASTRKAMEDLQAGRASEVRGVLDFVGETSQALVPFGFSRVGTPNTGYPHLQD